MAIKFSDTKFCDQFVPNPICKKQIRPNFGHFIPIQVNSSNFGPFDNTNDNSSQVRLGLVIASRRIDDKGYITVKKIRPRKLGQIVAKFYGRLRLIRCVLRATK